MSREEYEVGFGRVSPDGRYISYGSTESNNRIEIFIRPFDLAKAALAGEGKVQATKDGPGGGNIWRNDGQEVFYVRSEPGSEEVELKSVEVTPGPAVQVSEPKLLFKLRDVAGATPNSSAPTGSGSSSRSASQPDSAEFRKQPIERDRLYFLTYFVTPRSWASAV